MAGCKNLFAALVAICALAAQAQAQESAAKREEKSPRDTPRYGMLMAAVPLACARIYPAMAKKAAAAAAEFAAHFDTPAAKESWSRGSILPSDASEEMKRARQQRIACLVSHMQLNRAQCQRLVDAFADDASEVDVDAEQIEKDMRALSSTIAPCVSPVTNWPEKNDR